VKTRAGSCGGVPYRWVVAASGFLVLMSAIGLGRFAFAMQLPGMQAGMHLKSAQMGLLSTGNFCGYLLAMIVSPLLQRRYGSRTIVAFGLQVVGGSLLAMSQGRSFLFVALSFMATGVGTGLANVAMMALLARWFSYSERGKATGIVLCGNGAGIALAGVLIPSFTRMDPADGWRIGWMTWGLIGIASAAASWILLREGPEDAVASEGVSAECRGFPPFAQKTARRMGHPYSAPENDLGAEANCDNRGVMTRLSLLYLAFGVTSSVYGAFIVFSMVHEYGLSEAVAGFYWSWLGICSFFSGVAFGALSDRIGRRSGLAVVFGVYTIAFALAGLKLGHVALFVSVILFGFSIFGSVAIITAAIGDYFTGPAVARALSLASTVFAIGQTAGPIAAGAIASSMGAFTRAYLVGALITAGAAAFAFTLPAREKREERQATIPLRES
jgi:MFS family permease